PILFPLAMGYYAIPVGWFPSPSSLQLEAIAASASNGPDLGGNSSVRFVTVGGNRGGAVTPAASLGDIPAVLRTAAMTAARWASPLSATMIFPSLSPAGDEREGQLSVRGVRDIRIGNPWRLPYDWHPLTLQETIRGGPAFAITGCPGTSCSELTAAVGQ